MLRALIAGLLAFALTVAAGGAAAGTRGGTPVAFVSVERASQLVGVDLTTGRVIARIRVPAGPRAVTAHWPRHVLVTSPPAGAVTLVDTFTRRVVKTWRGFGHPADVEVESGYAYVTDMRRGQLVVIDLAARAIVGRAPVSPRPRSAAAGDLVLVAHGQAHPQLTLVDVHRPQAPKVIDRLSVPGPAYDISEQPDSNRAYFTNGERGGVGAVDTNGRIYWWRRVGAFTNSIEFDYYHGRRLWVTDRDNGHVLALSSNRNGRVLRRLRGCPGAHDVTRRAGMGRRRL